MTNAILRGKPDAGNPHVRFDEGEVASAKPRRGSLLYRHKRQNKLGAAVAVACCAGVAGVALATDIPFWGGGSSMPTRTPASEEPSAAAAPLDSRAVQTAESAAVAFDVDAAPGCVILFR